jgi:hypothetical protein
VTPWLLIVAYLAWTGLMLWFAATQRTKALGLTVLASFLLFVAFVMLGMKAANQDGDGTTFFGLVIFVAVAGPWLLGSVALAVIVRGSTALLARRRQRGRDKAEGTI